MFLRNAFLSGFCINAMYISFFSFSLFRLFEPSEWILFSLATSFLHLRLLWKSYPLLPILLSSLLPFQKASFLHQAVFATLPPVSVFNIINLKSTPADHWSVLTDTKTSPRTFYLATDPHPNAIFWHTCVCFLFHIYCATNALAPSHRILSSPFFFTRSIPPPHGVFIFSLPSHSAFFFPYGVFSPFIQRRLFPPAPNEKADGADESGGNADGRRWAFGGCGWYLSSMAMRRCCVFCGAASTRSWSWNLSRKSIAASDRSLRTWVKHARVEHTRVKRRFTANQICATIII